MDMHCDANEIGRVIMEMMRVVLEHGSGVGGDGRKLEESELQGLREILHIMLHPCVERGKLNNANTELMPHEEMRGKRSFS